MISATCVLRMGTDPEVRHLPDGTPVVSFRGASNEKRKGEEIATWIACSFFGDRGVKVAPFLRKGDKVAVSGTLSTREYDGKNGKGFSLELRVNELELLGTKPKNGDERDPFDP